MKLQDCNYFIKGIAVILAISLLSTFLLVKTYQYKQEIKQQKRDQENYIKTTNLFDKIYRGEGSLNSEKVVRTRASNWSDTENRYAFYEYRKSCLLSSERLLVNYQYGGEYLSINYKKAIISDQPNSFQLFFDYSYETKLLELYVGVIVDGKEIKDPQEKLEVLASYGMTQEELKAKADYVLYDVFLTDWSAANPEYTRFTKDNLGKLRIEKDELLAD